MGDRASEALATSPRRFSGAVWSDDASRPSLRPGDSVLFCDLQRASFDGADLSGVEFVGCRLDGASFQHTVLRGARIVACFSADDRPPVDFRGAVWDDAVVVDSHLHALADRAPTDDWRWPAEVAAAAASTLAARNDHRYEACKRLGVLGDQRPFGIVARLLSDREWEVRSIAIDTLGRLYRRTDGHVDRALLELLFLRLGDEHSLVRQSARRLIRVLAPPEEVLLQSSIGRLAAPNARDRLEGLLACGELVRADHAFARRVDRDARDRLVTDDDETVRAEAVHLLGVLDDGRAAIWARALADGAPAVRVEALKAIRLLSAPPEVSTVVPLLRDPDEAVRLETLYTIGQLGGVDLATLEPALSDPSADVREAVSRFFRARSD